MKAKTVISDEERTSGASSWCSVSLLDAELVWQALFHAVSDEFDEGMLL